MQVAGPRDAVTKFTAVVELTLDLGAPTSATVTQSTIGVPDALTATCSGNAKLGALLESVVAAIKEIVGWQTGTETSEAWNDKFSLLLAGCPYEEEFEVKIRGALAAGQAVTLERRNVSIVKSSQSALLGIASAPSSSPPCASSGRAWRLWAAWLLE